uniref:RING-type E3 ubiquitin transferase n=1 Tax=Fundulus heteroclitus TaxID=8078 RepID=A0A3Q2SX44_FUNHE
MAQHGEEDLPPNLACLKNVDTLLRCPICFDFLNITMMTKCSHNFCSLCIRKFLSYKLLCPVCNSVSMNNYQLLEDFERSYKLLKANFESPPISPKTPASAVKCKTPREKSQKSSSSILNHFFQKKPRTPPSKETHQDVQRGEPVDVNDPSIKVLMSVKQEDTAFHAPGFETPQSSSLHPNHFIILLLFFSVECPVCSVSVPQHFINKHLDTCLSRGEKKESLRSSQGPTVRPMAKLVYNLLSMQELKRRLRDCHLSMQGSRDQLIKRHQEFIHLYNSQCDSLNPKSVKEIAREVEANEKMRSQLQEKTKPVRKQHSSDFSRLIAQVRGRLQTTRQSAARRVTHWEVCNENVYFASCSDDIAVSTVDVVVKVEDDEDRPAGGLLLSSSPSFSDVSISR